MKRLEDEAEEVRTECRWLTRRKGRRVVDEKEELQMSGEWRQQGNGCLMIVRMIDECVKGPCTVVRA